MLATGLGHFRINMEDLGENWFAEYEGRRLYLEVSVLESASGLSENVSDISTKFVQSPYQFKWDRTVRWFKKGLPYEVKVTFWRFFTVCAENIFKLTPLHFLNFQHLFRNILSLKYFI